MADRQHIHHRLLDRGMSPWVVLVVIGALCLATGAAAFAATMLRSDALAWATAVTLLVLVVRLRLFGYYEFTLVAGAVRRLFARSVAAPPAVQRLAATVSHSAGTQAAISAPIADGIKNGAASLGSNLPQPARRRARPDAANVSGCCPRVSKECMRAVSSTSPHLPKVPAVWTKRLGGGVDRCPTPSR